MKNILAKSCKWFGIAYLYILSTIFILSIGFIGHKDGVWATGNT